MHRIRDRIRIRLNLMEIDFMNLETQLTIEQKKRAQRQKPLDDMLDMDKNLEIDSEKERKSDTEHVEDEVKATLLANRKLMDQQGEKDYKGRVLGTYENNFDFRATAKAWKLKVRRLAV